MDRFGASTALPLVVAAPTVSGVFRFILNCIASPFEIAADAFHRVAAGQYRERRPNEERHQKPC